MAIDRRHIEALVRSLRTVATDTQNIEVKESVQKLPASMLETVSAFCNGPGGTIILGLSERNGFTVAPGFCGKRMADSLATLCSDKLTPPIRPEIHVVDFEGAQLVVAHVHELPPREKPCYITERGVYQGSFVRVSDGDRKLSTYEVDRLMEERTQPTFDLDVVDKASLADLDATLVGAVLERQRSLHPKIFSARTDTEALAMLHVLERADDGAMRPTLAGLLALGTYPQQFFPRLTVAFTALPVRDEESGLVTYTDAQTMAGSIPSILADTLTAVRRNVALPQAPEFPLAAVREAVANALVHRDYSPLARGTAIQVNLTSEQLEVASPGGLYGTVTSENLGAPGYSSARNQYLLSLLEAVPFSDGYLVENRKAGYRMICSELERAGMPQPRVEDHLSSFVLTMFPARERAVREEDDEVVAYLSSVGAATSAELAEALGIPRRTATYRLARLVERGLVQRLGAPRSPKQRYRLA
ncbi:MAG: ATP-binding protein [Coriobacteriales bacterium]|nr:ATP-binding protein [Coriobacteriales bacterium]